MHLNMAGRKHSIMGTGHFNERRPSLKGVLGALGHPTNVSLIPSF